MSEFSLNDWTEVFAVDTEGTKFSPVLCRESDFTKYVVIHGKSVPVLRHGKTLVVGYPGRIISLLSASSLSGEDFFRFTKDIRRNIRYLNIDAEYISGILNTVNGSASEDDVVKAEQRDREIHLHMARGVEGVTRSEQQAVLKANSSHGDQLTATPLELKAQIVGQNQDDVCKLKGWQGHKRTCTCEGRLPNCLIRNWKPHNKKHHQAQVPKTSAPRCQFVASLSGLKSNVQHSPACPPEVFSPLTSSFKK